MHIAQYNGVWWKLYFSERQNKKIKKFIKEILRDHHARDGRVKREDRKQYLGLFHQHMELHRRQIVNKNKKKLLN